MNEPLYDSTQLKTFMSCPFQYFMKFVLGRVREVSEIALYDIEFGKRFHTFLEKYYLRQAPDLKQIWDGYECPEEEDSKTIEGGMKLCRDYHQMWSENDKSLKILGAEKIVKIANLPYDFVVKLDTIIERDGRIYSLEHKTCSTINQQYFEKFGRDLQILAQTAAIKQEYGDCAGVIINACRVKNYKRRTGDCEVGINTQFERHIVNCSDFEVQDFMFQAENWMKKIEETKQSGQYLKTLGASSCSSFRGCPYKEICSITVGSEVEQHILDDMFIEVDPLKYLKEDTE